MKIWTKAELLQLTTCQLIALMREASAHLQAGDFAGLSRQQFLDLLSMIREILAGRPEIKLLRSPHL